MTRLLTMLVALICMGCASDLGYRADWDLTAGWEAPIRFDVPPQPSGLYDVFIHLRNDNNYPYANIYLIARLQADSLTLHTDTLEYAMAEPSGKWLGTGFAAVKESKLYWRENIQWKDSTNYRIEIEHAQRAQGSAQGHKNLRGIVSVGYSIVPKAE